MREDQFKCGECGKIFDSEWTDEDAQKEYEKKFGHLPEILKENPAVVCDDCYKKLTETDLVKLSRLFRELMELIVETIIEDFKKLWKWISKLWRRIFKK